MLPQFGIKLLLSREIPGGVVVSSGLKQFLARYSRCWDVGSLRGSVAPTRRPCNPISQREISWTVLRLRHDTPFVTILSIDQREAEGEGAREKENGRWVFACVAVAAALWLSPSPSYRYDRFASNARVRFQLTRFHASAIESDSRTSSIQTYRSKGIVSIIMIEEYLFLAPSSKERTAKNGERGKRTVSRTASGDTNVGNVITRS